MVLPVGYKPHPVVRRSARRARAEALREIVRKGLGRALGRSAPAPRAPAGR